MRVIKARLSNNAQEFEILFPENLTEVDLSDFCDTIELMEEHDQLVKELREEDVNVLSVDFRFKYISLLGRIIAAFTGCEDLKQIMVLPLGSYSNHLKEYFGVESLQEIDFDDMEDSLLSLFRNITKIIGEYEFRVSEDDQIVLYRGERFLLREVDKNRITFKDLPTDLSTLEAVEILDLQRKLENSKGGVADKLFTTLSYQLAVLCRKEGEELPTDEVEFNRFVEGRQIFFTGEGKVKAIDAKTALDIDFFFDGRLGLVKRIVPLLISGIPQSRAAQGLRKRWQNILVRSKQRTKRSSAA